MAIARFILTTEYRRLGRKLKCWICSFGQFGNPLKKTIPYTLPLSSVQINFKWNSIGNVNGIISCINMPGIMGAQPKKLKQKVISAQSSDLQGPLQVVP